MTMQLQLILVLSKPDHDCSRLYKSAGARALFIAGPTHIARKIANRRLDWEGTSPIADPIKSENNKWRICIYAI
jgi:hypothetical protein